MKTNLYATTTKVTLAAFLTALLLATAVLGQDLDGTLKKIKTSGILTLGYRDAAPPFSLSGPDKQPVGYSVDLCTNVASAIQKQLGLARIQFQSVSTRPATP